jgi:hypothetical protein
MIAVVMLSLNPQGFALFIIGMFTLPSPKASK